MEDELSTQDLRALSEEPDVFDTLERALAGDLDAAATRHKSAARALQKAEDALSVREEIGRGGMGVVHHAYDGVLGRSVALKRPLERSKSLLSSQALLVREARITGLLAHPFIVPVYVLSLDERGRPYFTMKRVEGQTLRARLRAGEEGPRELWERLDVLLKVCDAVSYAHAHGVVHRDIKPDNVMIGSFGQVYLMDWGAAHVLDIDRLRQGSDVEWESEDVSLLTSPCGLGTPSYAPPEYTALSTLAPTTGVDVYALGVMLHEILTGRRPRWGADGELEEMGGMPPSLGALVALAVAPDPGERLSDASEFRSVVSLYMREGGVLETRRVEAGVVLMEQGERAECAYVLEDGVCEAYIVRGGEEVVLSRMEAGEVFGETALLTEAPRTASVRTLTACELRVISRAKLTRGLEGLPSWGHALLKTLAVRFRRSEARLHPFLGADPET